MREHFSIITDEVWQKLTKSGRVNTKVLFESVKIFQAENAPISKISLFYYIDEKGGHWVDGNPKCPMDRIAKSIFDCLGIKDKIEVAEYADWHENGDVDD